MTARQRMAAGVALLLMALPVGIGAHESAPHDPARMEGAPQAPQAPQALEAIAAAYQARVWPIFKESCANCHGTAAEMPWYYQVPGVRQLIDSDIREAREHLDLRNGFPFGGHGTPPEDLKAIAKALREGSMPPLRYRMLHGDAALTDAEQVIVQGWVRESLRLLEAQPAASAPGGGHASR